MKKLRLLLFVLLSVFLTLVLVDSKKVKADMFPKATARIEIIGVDKPYKFEILVKRGIIVDEYLESRVDNYYDDEFPFEFFKSYVDEDGYVSRTLYSGGAPATLRKEGEHRYLVGYYSAPDEFKIILLFEDDVVITSKVVKRRMFESKMTFDLTGVDLSSSKSGVGVVIEDIPYVPIISKFIIRVVLTILVELGILALFSYRSKRSFMLVGISNLVTQSLLTLFMFIAHYTWMSYFGALIILIIGEFFVFLAEMIFYGLKLKEHKKGRAVLYGFVANLATLLLSIFTIAFI